MAKTNYFDHESFKPPTSYITYPVWDSTTQREMVITTTLEQLIESPPAGLNLAWIGLHFLNTLRIARNLPTVPPQDLNLIRTGDRK